ncbi:MAG: acyl-ACP--UDP-N-acetylglucosamine O-acyltransferase [Syntrophales bacterium]|jgi:UDP-N-acetylglucosamine acyltransferase|nr:acyl-ACP--UDP-N-acetylglucosamine O-acyltransferase [Syntrophales bacterium]MDY0044523.1 acyl-ACP--UDP-N-acetylglucosamine O-acyltransferase [Syntrophales bacterium]
MNIHPTAIVSPDAHIGAGVKIGPYSIIGSEVILGQGTVIGPHVVIEGPTEIGDKCRIFQFASIGAEPQDLKYKGEKCKVVIGDNNTIREYVTINRSTAADIGMTAIGDNNLLMAYCHVAHNCMLGNNIVMSNAVNLAGHVHVEDFAVIGGMSGIHQFCRVGCHSMIGGASAVTNDVPPFVVVSGNRAKIYGLNVIGLKRRGFRPEVLKALKDAYRLIFRSSLLRSEAIKKAKSEIARSEEVDRFLRFIENSERGICR